MKEFRQVIPEGMEARVENGEVIYTPIEKCQFEVGDVLEFAGHSEAFRLFEGVDKHGRILRKGFYDKNTDMFELSENMVLGNDVNLYTKATPEQEVLFNQKCLENGVWFDRENKKWIKLKEGEVYCINFDKGVNCTIIFKEIYNYNICDYSYYNEKAVCKLIISENATGSIKATINISEATEEERQQLFDALKEKGKQWNAEKRCVEDLMWKPEDGETYWLMASDYEAMIFVNNLRTDDIKRFAIGNCFKTQEEAEKYAEYMRECSKKYKPE